MSSVPLALPGFGNCCRMRASKFHSLTPPPVINECKVANTLQRLNHILYNTMFYVDYI